MNKFIDMVYCLARRQSLGCLAAAVACCAVYSNMFANEFVLSDYVYILDWPLIQNLMNIQSFFIHFIPPEGQPGLYSPLKTLFYALNYHFWQTEPSGYHIVALCIHLAGILCVYRLAVLLTGQNTVSFLTALLFAVHPAQVESVVFMSESAGTLGMVFMFVSFIFYIKAFGSPAEREASKTQSRSQQRQSRRNFAISTVFAFFGFMTNEQALILPALALLYEFCFDDKRNHAAGMVKRVLPSVLLAAVYGLMKWKSLGTLFAYRYVQDSVAVNIFIGLKALSRYLWLALLPADLTINHAISPGIFSIDANDFDKAALLSQSLIDIPSAVSLLVLIFMGVLFFVFLRKKPLVSFCIGWFYLSLLPVFPAVPRHVFFAERYLYSSLFSFCLLGAVLILQISSRAGQARRWLTGGLIAALLAGYSYKSHERIKDWENPITLYKSAIASNPESAMLHAELGIVYLRLEEFERALYYFEQAYRLRPDDPHIPFSMAEVYDQMNSYDEAIEYLGRAIELNPSFAEAYVNLAALYGHLDIGNKSEFYLNKAVQLYKQQGRLLEAGETLQAFEAARDYHMYKSIRWAVESTINEE